MSDPAKSGTGYPGQAGLFPANSDFNKTSFLVEQMLAYVRTATLVQIKKCTNAGDLSPVGFVDVLPLVNMIDGLAQSSQHTTIFNLPYCRVQGGLNAIIMDPQVGDIGIAVFADRDISSVKATKKQSNPGSRRRFNMADGVYLFGVLNATPTQYVQFNDAGINITDKNGNTIVMNSDGITMNGVLFDRSQNISKAAKIDATDEITAKSGSGSSVKVTSHRHGTGTPIAAATTAPTGGT